MTASSHCPSMSLKEWQKSDILAYLNLHENRNAMAHLKELNNFMFLLCNRNIGSCVDSENANMLENKSMSQTQRRTHESSNLRRHRGAKARQRNWCFHDARPNSMLFDPAYQWSVILNSREKKFVALASKKRPHELYGTKEHA